MVLTVPVAVANVTEPDIGQFTTVTGCFVANLSIPRTVDHLFEFALSSESTAIAGIDFFPNLSSPFLVIPAGVIDSAYTTCVDVVIFGDNTPEPSPEVVIYDIVPLSFQDSVAYPPGFTSLIINIFDNDNGKEDYIE